MKKTQLQKFRMSGNNGGDYFHIEEIKDGRVFLEIGHCCVVSTKHIIPIELLTAVLTQVGIECAVTNEKDVCVEMAKKYCWIGNEKYQNELIAKIIDVCDDFGREL